MKEAIRTSAVILAASLIYIHLPVITPHVEHSQETHIQLSNIVKPTLAVNKVTTATPAKEPTKKPIAIPKKVAIPKVKKVTPIVTPTVVQAPITDNAAMEYIFSHESSHNLYAVNPGSGACGIGQAWPCSKLTSVCELSNYTCQVNYFTNYAITRYGSWQAAADFWANNNWW